ncbi:nucleotidyltransferase family protein [bacterium]|nr:nucleotidyltransferase family protein [bacterium]
MNDDPFTSAVLLAAGCSSRLGPANKLLLPIGGKSIIRRSAENVLKTDVNELIVVTGKDIAPINYELRQLSAKVVLNRNYILGISSSIIAGIRAVNPLAEGVIVLLADQPNIQPDTINRFLQAFHKSGKRIIAGKYNGVLGNPVLFHRSLFPELHTLQGDVGAKQLLDSHTDEIEELHIATDEIFDLDTHDDYRQMKGMLQT